MVKIGNGAFDASTVEPNTAFDPLPAGWYVMSVKGAEWKETKAGDGRYLKFQLVIDESHHPELKGRVVFDNLNLVNPNQTAVEIAQRSLSAICRACSVMQMDDTDQLIGIPIAVKLSVRPAKGDWEASNDVKGYDAASVRFPRGGAAPQPGGKPAASTTAAPWAQ